MNTASRTSSGTPASWVASTGAATWRDFFALLKPRVMTLVVFTGLCGLLAAPGSIHPVIGFTAILCIAVGAGAAGALNMWFEAETDALMARTASRPIPAGRVNPDEAFAFAVTLAGASVLVMTVAVGWLAAALLLGSILFYVLVYTVWLKRRTPQNIVIGGAAGAFPPMIGWAAVTGSVDPLAWLLFGIIFLWTPPHFWALSLFACKDYARAGIPMLPVVAGERETRRQIWLYSWLMLAASLAPLALPLVGQTGLGPVYGVAAAILGLLFIIGAYRVRTARPDTEGYGYADAKALFGYSIVYLFALFAALVADRIAFPNGLGFWG